MADVAGGLREDLAAAITEAEKPLDVEIETPEAGAPEAEKPSGERARGPDGKFLAKDAVESPAEPAEAETKPEATEAAVEPEKAPADPAQPDPTARWSDVDKAMFKTLPKEGQDFLLRRHKDMEADYTKKTAAVAELRTTYEPVAQMFAPFKPQMRQQGWTEATLIKAWADVEQQLMTGKGADVIARIVRDYKLNPQDVSRALGQPAGVPSGAAAAAPAQADAPRFDPQVEALLEAKFGAVLTPLQKQLADLKAEADGRVRFQQQQQQTAAEQTIQQFIDAKAPDGSPVHPHYAEVENDMVALARIEAQAGRKPDLGKLYDAAVWANPSTREKLRAAESAALAKKSQEEARAKAAAAKKASVSVTGAPGSGQVQAKPSAGKTLREQLMEAAEEHDAA